MGSGYWAMNSSVPFRVSDELSRRMVYRQLDRAPFGVTLVFVALTIFGGPLTISVIAIQMRKIGLPDGWKDVLEYGF